MYTIQDRSIKGLFFPKKTTDFPESYDEVDVVEVTSILINNPTGFMGRMVYLATNLPLKSTIRVGKYAMNG